MKRILTIAGSDTGGGAGIQADLKTIAMLEAHGMSVITALTAQNSLGVQSVYPVPLPFIETQMDAVLSDMVVDGAKTGMLWNSEVVMLVTKKLVEYRVKKLVVDPIMIAKDGSALLDEDGREALKKELIPRAVLVTPNLPEAAALTGLEVRTVKAMKEAARRIHSFGAEAVLVKGGHLRGDPVDVLFDGSVFTEFSSERAATEEAHGTGCILSAAIATELAKGVSLGEAVQRGRSLTILSIKAAIALGKGKKCANPSAYFAYERGKYEVIRSLRVAIDRLKGEEDIGELIPEVSSNLGYALPFAQNKWDVAAVPGRIIRLGKTVATVDAPEFGASQHIASIILTVMRYDPSFRSAINVRFSPTILQACREGGLHLLGFDRRQEPQEVKEREGSSLVWGIEKVLTEAGEVPDVVYDEGGWGKEPMLRILGKDPGEVAQKVIVINTVLKGRRSSKTR
jgi:hydroxymethylpyrimidine kinase/phosphomethylpyrimidine kinase